MNDIHPRIREQMSILIREGKDDVTVEAMLSVPRWRVMQYRERLKSQDRPFQNKLALNPDPIGYSERGDPRRGAEKGSSKLLAALQEMRP